MGFPLRQRTGESARLGKGNRFLEWMLVAHKGIKVKKLPFQSLIYRKHSVIKMMMMVMVISLALQPTII